MSKQSMIRWKQSDYLKLGRSVSNFNKQIAKLSSKEGDVIVPDTLSYKDVKAGISTRKEYNRLIKSLQNFSNPDKQKSIKLDSGVKITNWEYTELKKGRNRAVQRMTNELVGLEAVSNFGTGNSRINEIKATIKSLYDLEKLSGSEFRRIKRRINYQGNTDYEIKQAQRFKDNFIKEFKSLGREEIVKYAESFRNPIDFWEAIKDTAFAKLQEWYDEAKGTVQFAMESDERYEQELEKLGLSLEE